MCLEFLCWGHKDEDGPEHHPHNQHTGLSARSEPPSKPPINGTEYPTRDEPSSKPHSEPSINGTNTWNGDAYPARHDPPSKPRPEPYNGSKNQVVSGVAVNGDTKRKDEHSKTSSMAFNGEEVLKVVHPRPNASVPHVGNNTVLAGVHTNG